MDPALPGDLGEPVGRTLALEVGDERVKAVVLPMETADLERRGVPEGFTDVARQGRVHLLLGDG